MSDTALNDDYIISLLKRDAEANKRQSSLGSSSYLSTARRRPDAPKPNTRFLKNLVRDADSHNAALKAKEEADAKSRMEKLKRRREGQDGDDGEGKRRRGGGERKGRWASVLGGLSGGNGDRGGEMRISERAGNGRGCEHSDEEERASGKECRRRSRSRDGERRRRRREADRSEEGNVPSQARSRSPPTRRRKHHAPRDSHRKETSRSPPRPREHPRHRKRSQQHRPSSPLHLPSKHPKRQNRSPATPEENYPLDPDPDPGHSPPLPRGRGAHKTSTISAHFASTYDPKTDVPCDHEGQVDRDDWDLAVEALRDRAKYRRAQADRLRAAGFTDEEVGRWEGGMRERGVEDVRWRKIGEGRAWDEGKIVEGQGEEEKGAVEVFGRARWVEEGRLKGT